MSASDSEPESTCEHARFDPLCLVLGWLLPGLGYFRLGQRRRGSRVMIGVLALVVIGVLIGGVDVVDRREDHLWFLPQMLIGPLAFGIDYLNLTIVKAAAAGTQSIGRVNEIGTLYVALAGLMNLAAMIDSATRPGTDAPPRRRVSAASPPAEPAAAAAKSSEPEQPDQS